MTKPTSPETLKAAFAVVHDGVTEAHLKALEGSARRLGVILSLLMFARVETVADGKPTRYATMTGRNLQVVQTAYKVGGEIARIGERCTDSQAAAVSTVNSHKITRSVKVRDAYLTDANGGEPIGKVTGPEYGRLYTIVLARVQAETKATAAEQAAAVDAARESGEEVATEQPGKPFSSRLDGLAGTLKAITASLPTATDDDIRRYGEMLRQAARDLNGHVKASKATPASEEVAA